MRIQTANGDARRCDAELLLQARVQDLEHFEQTVLRQVIGHLTQRQVSAG